MKKLFAIMLCALLAVCAVVPSFAATEISSKEMTDPFVEAEIFELKVGDFVNDQPQLFNNTDYWAENGGPDYSKPGFAGGDPYITFWGCEKSMENWDGMSYQMTFNAPVDGYYSFAFLMDCGGGQDGTAYVPCWVDDGEEYHVMFDGAWKNASSAYYGMDEIYLEAGDHVFHFSRARGTDKTQYYYGVQYTYVADEAGEDTTAAPSEDTTAAPSEDTTAAPTTGGTTAPATFDVAVIALAVAGASAAVAVVSKKRR